MSRCQDCTGSVGCLACAWQDAAGARSVPHGEEPDALKLEKLKSFSSKHKAVIARIQELASEDSSAKFLVFSQFTRFLFEDSARETGRLGRRFQHSWHHDWNPF